MKINLTKIEIDNYKSINDFSFKLVSNSTNSKKEILLGSFKEINNQKSIVPGYVALFGRNSIGKTSIFNAISYFSSFINGTISRTAITSVVNKEFNSYRGSNSFAFGQNLQKLVEAIESQIKSKDGRYYSDYVQYTNSIIDNSFQKLAFENKKPIRVKLYFQLGVNKTFISFSNTRDKASITYNNKSTKKEQEIMFDYVGSIVLPSSELAINDNTGINASAENIANNQDFMISKKLLPAIIEFWGIKKTVQLLHLADKRIKNLKLFTNSISGKKELENITFDYGINDVSALSSGTKRFINLVYRIILPINRKIIRNGALVLIDELEINLHKELINSVKMLMNLMFEKYNIQYIFTTHNPYSIASSTSNKQIFSLEDSGSKLKVIKLSDIIKPHQSKLKLYSDNIFATFPDKEEARNIISKLL